MPQLGETVTEGTITKWHKQVGETVAEDEVLFEVSTDKVDSEVPSPTSGTVTEILVQEGETVSVGVKLAVIGAPAGKAANGAADAPPSTRTAVAETAGPETAGPETAGPGTGVAETAGAETDSLETDDMGADGRARRGQVAPVPAKTP